MSCEAVESGYGGGGVLTCAAVGFGNSIHLPRHLGDGAPVMKRPTTGQWKDRRRRMGRAECSLHRVCRGCCWPSRPARRGVRESLASWAGWLACCLATLHGLETRQMREREKEVVTGFGNGPDRTDWLLQKRLPLFRRSSASARAKRTMCVSSSSSTTCAWCWCCQTCIDSPDGP